MIGSGERLDSGKKLIVRLDNSIVADREQGVTCPCWQVTLAKQGQAIGRAANDKDLTFFDEAKGFDALNFKAAFVAGAILRAGGGGGGCAGHGQRIRQERTKRNIFSLLFKKFFFRKALTRL
jgi:hypothetical protein